MSHVLREFAAVLWILIVAAGVLVLAGAALRGAAAVLEWLAGRPGDGGERP